MRALIICSADLHTISHSFAEVEVVINRVSIVSSSTIGTERSGRRSRNPLGSILIPLRASIVLLHSGALAFHRKLQVVRFHCSRAATSTISDIAVVRLGSAES